MSLVAMAAELRIEHRPQKPEDSIEPWDDALDSFTQQLVAILDELSPSEREALFGELRAKWPEAWGAR